MLINSSSIHDWVAAGVPDLFSVVIPARNEAKNLQVVVPTLRMVLEGAGVNHEILVVNDGSTDDTRDVLVELAARYSQVRFIDNPGPIGFGLAVRAGLANFRGDAVAIVMADGSDDPTDVVKCNTKLQEGYDCVFGSRFIAGSKLVGYPVHKLIINRLANLFIKSLFQIRYNDITNAFKCYRREVIAGLEPILAHHFNLTVELPLKAIIRGYNFTVVPISWTNRTYGISKLRIREMGSRYLFIVLYCFIERILSRGDYRRKRVTGSSAGKREVVAPGEITN
jgi:dolichol-phosphate mannosyltransferase